MLLTASIYVAFGQADVVFLCFSICSAQSLRNIRTFWVQEARKHRKNVPHFVVGCKADLRHCDLETFNNRRGQLATKVFSIYRRTVIGEQVAIAPYFSKDYVLATPNVL